MLLWGKEDHFLIPSCTWLVKLVFLSQYTFQDNYSSFTEMRETETLFRERIVFSIYESIFWFVFLSVQFQIVSHSRSRHVGEACCSKTLQWKVKGQINVKIKHKYVQRLVCSPSLHLNELTDVLHFNQPEATTDSPFKYPKIK